MLGPARDRFFHFLASLGTRRPERVLLAAGVLMFSAAMVIPGMRISTSRYALVANDDPYQARLRDFFDRFGYPDAALLVVEGGSAGERRALVDVLIVELQRVPTLRGRVLGRLGPTEVAEVLLLQRPDIVTMLKSALPQGEDVASLLEGGLPSITAALQSQLQMIALTMQMQALSPFGSVLTATEAERALRWTTRAAEAIRRSLDGEDIWAALTATADASELPKWAGIDAKGYLASSDGSFHLVSMFPELPDDQVSLLEPLIKRVRSIRDQALARFPNSSLRASLTGVPALAVDELDIIQRGIFQSSFATACAIIALFMFAFRSVRQTVIAGLPLLVGIIVTMAVARLLYGQLNLITSSFISVLLGLGIDFSVHTLARYNELRREQILPVDSIVGAVTRSGPAILTGALTTALAFLTTATTDFTAFAELGVITAIGLGVMLVLALLVIPPMVVSTSRFDVAAPPELPGLARLPALVARAPRALLALGLGAGLAAGLGIAGLEFNGRYFDFLPTEMESAQALKRLENDRVVSPSFAVVTAASVEEAQKMAVRLRELREVAAVQTPTDLLPPLTPGFLAKLHDAVDVTREPVFAKLAGHHTKASDLLESIDGIVDAVDMLTIAFQLVGRPSHAAQAARAQFEQLRLALVNSPDDGVEALARLQAQLAPVVERAWLTARNVAERGHYDPADLPDIFKMRFISRDEQRVALYVYPSGDIWQREVADAFTARLEEVDPQATGFAITTNRHIYLIVDGFKRAAVIAGLLVLVMLLIDLRSPVDVLLAMLPVFLGGLWMLGLMSAASIPLNVANIVVLPLILGIGIDAGVHLVHRCRESAAANKGIARLDDLLRGTGAAVMVSSMTTMAGFAGLMVADYGAMRSLGLAMVIGVATCLLASLLVLPAVLLLMGRVR